MGATLLDRLARRGAVTAFILTLLASPAAGSGELRDGTMYLLIEGGILLVILVVLIAMDRAEG